jgi:hypothetical protein
VIFLVGAALIAFGLLLILGRNSPYSRTGPTSMIVGGIIAMVAGAIAIAAGLHVGGLH